MLLRHGAASLAAAALLCACGEPAAPAAPRAPNATFDTPARGGSVALDAEAFIAFAADTDNRALHALDLATSQVTTTALDAVPEQVVLIGDTRVAVTLRDQARVLLLERDPDGGPLRPIAAVDVPVDPFGLALTPRGELLVTSAYGRALTALDAATLERRWSLPMAREPRGVVASPDGRRAFVTHLVGDAVTVVDLPQGERGEAVAQRVAALGGRYRNRVDTAALAGTLHPTAALAYAAVLSPSGSRLFIPHAVEQSGADTIRSIPGAYGGVPVEEETSFASVAVLETSALRLFGDAGPAAQPIRGLASIAADPSLGFSVAPGSAPCRQARAVALAGDALLVASQGTGELVELDARALDPAMTVRRVYPVGAGPTGVDVDPATGLAVVWSQLDHGFTVLHLGSGATEEVPAAGDPLPADVAAGRRLFLTERDRRITRDGRACAGCHPEGRDDGVVWKLGAGPRQTPTLVGRLDIGPYGWLGKHARLEDNMRETITRLGGTGLSETDLGHLAAYLRRGLARVDPAARGKAIAVTAGGDTARGRAIFASAEAGCAGCHRLEDQGSDRAVHNVASRNPADQSAGFRTPPLLFVGDTAPYFHDGRYATLEALLDDNLDRMGQTSHLSAEELGDLVAFLRTL